MRCKRCGELLDPAEIRCPVCGKTVNPPRRKAPAQKPGETNIKLPQLDRFTHTYGRDAARSRTLQLATIGAVLAAIVLLVLVFVGVGELKDAVSELKHTADSQLQVLQSQSSGASEQSAQPQTDPPTEPADDSAADVTADPAEATGEEESLPLRQQQVNATLTLYAAADDAYASASMTLGGYDDRAIAWVRSGRSGTERRTCAVWILEESGDRVMVSLDENYSGIGNLLDMTLSWDSQGDIFGDLGSPVCIWEYQVGGSAWESLPTEHLTPIVGGCELKMSADAVKLLLAQYSQMELRCHITLTHPAGGTVKVLVDGVILDAEGLVVSGSLID